MDTTSFDQWVKGFAESLGGSKHKPPTAAEIADWLNSTTATPDMMGEFVERLQDAGFMPPPANLPETWIDERSRFIREATLNIQPKGAFRIFLVLMQEGGNIPPGLHPVTEADILDVHEAMLQSKKTDNHPLRPIVLAAMTRGVESAPDKRRYAIVPNAAYRKAKPAELPAWAAPTDDDAPGPTFLPGLEPIEGPSPAWPLVMMDAAGLDSMTKGRGAPLPLRIGLEALMQAPPAARERGTHVILTLRDVVNWGWPNGRWQPHRNKERLADAFARVERLVLHGEWNVYGRIWTNWEPVKIRAQSFDSLEAAVLINVWTPPGSGSGPLIDREQLRAYGVDSAPLYRGYLSAAYHWNEHGTRLGKRILPVRKRVRRNAQDLIIDAKGEVIRERGGKPTRNPDHPRAVQLGGLEDNPAAERFGLLRVFTPNDLAQLVHGQETLRNVKNVREYQRRAVEAFERMAEDGVLKMIEDANTEGQRGWLILPPDGFGPD